MYTSLVRKFGPYSEWENKYSPGYGRNSEFEEFKRFIADLVAFDSGQPTTPGAVDQQIAWAVTKQTNIKSVGHVYTYIQNVSAALRCGFLKSDDLPKVLEVRS